MSFLNILRLIVNQARLQIKDGIDDYFSSEKHCPDNLGSIQALSQRLRIVQISLQYVCGSCFFVNEVK